MDTSLQPVRTAFRSLRRAPGFTLTAILTLALGIGLATAVFTVADALLLRQLPVVNQDRIAVVAGVTPDGQTTNYPLSVADAQEFVRRSRALSGAALFAYEGAAAKPVREGEQISRLRRALVSGNYFMLLGAKPLLGRGLTADDDAAGAEPVLVLSYRAWQQRFGSAGVLGQRVVMHEDGISYRVVGVMPQGLDYPRGTDAWAAILAATPAAALPFVSVNVIGRLAPTATPMALREEMTAFFSRTDAPLNQRQIRGVVHSLPELVIGDTRPAVLVFAGAAALLLLITCVNVANLLLVRGLGRTREIAVRFALGATRRRVVGQLLLEHALLAVGGGLFAIGIAALTVRLFVAYAPSGTPRLDEIELNGMALLAACATTLLAMGLFAIMPALFTSKVDAEQALRSGTRQSGTRFSRLVSEALVTGQVTLAVVIVSAAALIGRSLLNLQRADLAYDTSNLTVVELSLRADRYKTAAKQVTMLSALVPAIRAIPGVAGVAPVVSVPFSVAGWDATPYAEGTPPDAVANNPLLNMELATPEYFSTLGLRITAGRAFTAADRAGTTPVAMLSESAAKHYWPNESAIGKRLVMGTKNPRSFEVVGVVPDTRYRDLRVARASIYFPLQQSFFPFAPTTLVIRSATSLAAIIHVVRRTIAESAPDVAVVNAVPFSTFLAAPLAQPRLNALLLGIFAVTALVLASIGLFGVLATMVQRRTREFGVRMALGASAAVVGRMVLRRGLTLAAAGCAVGLLAAMGVNQLMTAMLFEVTPTDVRTLFGTIALLLVIAAIASLVPARTSTRISPLEAMRSD